jgi:hypothetical protein
VHQLTNPLGKGGVADGGEGYGAAPGCGEKAVGIRVGGKEEYDGCPEYYRQPILKTFNVINLSKYLITIIIGKI